MLRIEARHTGSRPATLSLTLPFDVRQKSRLKASLDSGQPVAILLDRGTALRHGDLLETTDGQIVRVQGAPEPLSCAEASDPLLLARAAYHLGNRHVAVEITPLALYYQHDHVLDDMLRQLGLSLSLQSRAFEPESGAYGSGHPHAVRSHSHEHGHAHGHGHAHEHGHSHEHGHAHEHGRSHGRVHVHVPSLSRRASDVGTQSGD